MDHLCENYEQWKHCITIKCRIELTAECIRKRITALSDQQEPTTARFIELYGDSHRLRTIRWFERAQGEIVGEC